MAEPPRAMAEPPRAMAGARERERETGERERETGERGRSWTQHRASGVRCRDRAGVSCGSRCAHGSQCDRPTSNSHWPVWPIFSGWAGVEVGMVIARYLLHAEQGLAVRASPARRQHLPMRKKRRALHEKASRTPPSRCPPSCRYSPCCGDDPSGRRRPLSVPSAGFPVFSCRRRTTSRFPDASPVSAPGQRVAPQ